MLMSHRKHFIYTKTIKTAGTSVECYFEPYCLPEGPWEFRHSRNEHVSTEGIIGYRGPKTEGKTWRNHMPASEIRDRIGDSIWNGYFKFCVIRNPFDKLVSAFYFFENQRKNRPTALQSNRPGRQNKNLEAFRNVEGNNPVERFRSWIRNGGSIIDRNKYVIDGKICMDYFIRFEDLQGGIKHVCSILDIPFESEKIPKLKSGIRQNEIPLHEYYDPATVEIVSRLYKFEVETFGYSEPNETNRK
jgi:Sulfotransferase family